MKRSPKRIVILFFVLAIVGGILYLGLSFALGLRQIVSGSPEIIRLDPVQLTEVVAVRRGTLEEKVNASGTVQSPTQVSLSFQTDSGIVKQVYVRPGDQVEAGAEIARLDTSEIEDQLVVARRQLQDAEKELADARLPASDTDLLEGRLAIQSAETRLLEAQEALNALTDEHSTSLQAAVTEAERKLSQARISLLELQKKDIEKETGPIQERYARAAQQCIELGSKANPTDLEADMARRMCNELLDGDDQINRLRLSHERELKMKTHEEILAERELAEAQEALKEGAAGADPQRLAEAELAVAEAQARLLDAQEKLQELEAGSSSRIILDKEIAVDRARLTVMAQAEKLEQAALKAPFGGTITAVHRAPGDRVSAGTVVAGMADLTALRVVVEVDETEISRIREDQAVSLSLYGMPERQFTGSVHAVPVQGTLSAGLVVYKVIIALDQVPAEARLGMTVLAEIRVGEARETLLVPASAVRQESQGFFVNVVGTPTEAGNPSVESRQVVVGRSDGVYTEILDGLKEDEKVEVRYEPPARGW